MSDNQRSAVEAVVARYIDGATQGNVEELRSIFHPQAAMFGYIQGDLLAGGVEPYFDAVANTPAPASSGEPYSAEITEMHVDGTAASATISEKSYLGMQFTTFFHLLQIDGDWKIVSKTFYQS